MTVGGATTRYALDVAGGLPEVIAATGGATTQYLQVQGQVLAQYDSGTWSYVAPDALPALGPQAQVGSVRQVGRSKPKSAQSADKPNWLKRLLG
jgi:hypothetical protein